MLGKNEVPGSIPGVGSNANKFWPNPPSLTQSLSERALQDPIKGQRQRARLSGRETASALERYSKQRFHTLRIDFAGSGW